MNLLPSTFLLGLAGIDPVGAIIVFTSLTMGIKKNKSILFIITVFFSTVLLGVISSDLLLYFGVDYISNIFDSIPDSAYMILELIVGIVLLLWAIERTFFKEKKETKEKKKESIFIKYINKGPLILGLLFSISFFTDPSFLALITLMAKSNNLIENTIISSIWILISQLPLFILFIAIIFNQHNKMINYFKNKIATAKRVELIKKIIYVILTILIIVSSVLLLIDSINYFINKFI